MMPPNGMGHPGMQMPPGMMMMPPGMQPMQQQRRSPGGWGALQAMAGCASLVFLFL
jgi:hypothetical protein